MWAVYTDRGGADSDTAGGGWGGGFGRGDPDVPVEMC